MTPYIDIDLVRNTIDGTPGQAATRLQKVREQPARYLCLLRNDYTGQYRYADFQSNSDRAGDSDNLEQ